MMLLEKLISLFSQLDVPIETGIFSGQASEQYIVLIPVTSTYELYADNLPEQDIEEVRISIYSKTNYLSIKRILEKILLKNGLTITERRYNGYEKESKYHHFTIDVADHFNIEEEQ